MAWCRNRLSPEGQATGSARPHSRCSSASGLSSDGRAPIFPPASCRLADDNLLASAITASLTISILLRLPERSLRTAICLEQKANLSPRRPSYPCLGLEQPKPAEAAISVMV